jgi:predicted ATPase
MITDVYIKNFRGIGEETVQLGRMSVLVGKNGAGKSSFVDALRFVRDALTLGLEDAVLVRHGIAALRRWAPTRPYDLEIRISINAPRARGTYGFTLASGRDGDFRVKHEFGEIGGELEDGKAGAKFEREGKEWIHLPDKRGRSSSEDMLDDTALALPSLGFFTPDFLRIQRFLREMTFYTIFPNTLREPQKPSPSRTLSDHGENLATIARRLKTAGKHSEIVATLNNVVGGIRDLDVQQAGGFLVTQLLHSMSQDQTTWFDLSQESDGTLRLLGILVALSQRANVSFVAIEEPELTLHPGAVAILSDILKEAAARRQLLITTQSPDLISRFAANDLRIVERGSSGATTIQPIAEHQRQAIEQQLFSAGDLLRIEGLHSATNS